MQNKTNNLVIRATDDMADLEKITDLQIEVWGFPPREAIPAHLMKSIGKGPCKPIIAELGDELVGFIYAFNSQNNKELYVHMIGVHPGYRSNHIGVGLIVAQKETAEKQGIETISWTYDPLEGANSNLYVRKIGGIVEGDYLRDNYGDQPGRNEGLPSDRFVLKARMQNIGRNRKSLNTKTFEELKRLQIPFALKARLENGLQVCEDYAIIDRGEVLVEIPRDFVGEIKPKDMDQAIKWRAVTGDLFETYFARGYFATDFFSVKNQNRERRNFYLLERQN